MNIFLKIFIFLIIAIVITVSGFFVYQIKIVKPEQNRPQYASVYSITKLNSLYETQAGSKIILHFQNTEKAHSLTPQYELVDLPEQSQTKITFHNIGEVNTNFLYNDVLTTNNPLIEELSYQKTGKDFLMIIKRKGALLPSQVVSSNQEITIVFPLGTENYPQFSDFTPAPDSVVFPANQEISLTTALQNPFKEAFLFLNGRPVAFSVTSTLSTSTQNQSAFFYKIFFYEKLKKDEFYKIRIVVLDEKNQGTAVTWEFGSQLPQQRGVLGSDRFQYLGWWGQINTNQTRVRKEPSTKSEIIGELSTINKVKVLDEVSGENVEGISHWYKIDGGKYAGGYVFSEAVTPLPQPQAPTDFIIPKEVQPNEYWIDVSITKEIFTLFKYNKPVFVTYVSTGRIGSETVTGTFRIHYKLIKK
ncbi:MAG: SH3 domain-containing protein, partial [Candidatus Gribaldobacteria bacterium]|nr:SH3 domain-containing protein [Candidatus Gribaldobacteria bacterium]